MEEPVLRVYDPIVCAYVGAVLGILPVTITSESSLMSRDLCVVLVNFGSGLERGIFVDLQFIPNGFTRQSTSSVKEVELCIL